MKGSILRAHAIYKAMRASKVSNIGCSGLLYSSTPRLPFNIPTNRDHKALNGVTLGGSRLGIMMMVLGGYLALGYLDLGTVMYTRQHPPTLSWIESTTKQGPSGSD